MNGGPASQPPPDATPLMNAAAAGGEGGRAAADRLLPLVYEQLRGAAQQQMGRERAGHTLSATALVHEAYVRLVGGAAPALGGRAQFFKAAAEAMRRILVEHARARARLKRGGDGQRPARRVPLSALDLADADRDPEEILRLEDALRRLEGEDEGAAAVVRLRFFAGLSGDQTAEMLGISPSSVDREWAFARARLYRLMQPEG